MFLFIFEDIFFEKFLQSLKKCIFSAQIFIESFAFIFDLIKTKVRPSPADINHEERVEEIEKFNRRWVRVNLNLVFARLVVVNNMWSSFEGEVDDPVTDGLLFADYDWLFFVLYQKNRTLAILLGIWVPENSQRVSRLIFRLKKLRFVGILFFFSRFYVVCWSFNAYVLKLRLILILPIFMETAYERILAVDYSFPSMGLRLTKAVF